MTLFIFVDISKVQEREKIILESKFRNIFLSSFSHNLKTPLNSLIMNNEILERKLKIKEYAGIIGANTSNLTLL
jgi:signal transduction histidine kinase